MTRSINHALGIVVSALLLLYAWELAGPLVALALGGLACLVSAALATLADWRAWRRIQRRR